MKMPASLGTIAYGTDTLPVKLLSSFAVTLS